MKRIAKAILDKNKTCGKNGAFDVFSQELSSENLRGGGLIYAGLL